MDIRHGCKVIWTASVNYWTGEIIDVDIRVVKKGFAGGNTYNNNEIAEITIYPRESDYKECGYDKKKVIEKIMGINGYKRDISKSIYAQDVR